MSLSASMLERKKKSRNIYTCHDAVRMVVVNGLNPTEALRACLNPCSRQRLNYLLANGGDMNYISNRSTIKLLLCYLKILLRMWYHR